MNILNPIKRLVFKRRKTSEQVVHDGVHQPSVFVGGLGGSGTRVVADVLQTLDFSMGFDLNESLDDLTYTLLLKRPDWFTNATAADRNSFLHLYIKVRLGQVLDERDRQLLRFAYEDMHQNGHNAIGDGKGNWAIQRLKACELLPKLSEHTRWGWKEPNSFLMAKPILAHFNQTKFVFVMRHGLDMAFSSNRQQLYNWHALFGIENPRRAEQLKLPNLMLQYWLAAADAMQALQNEVGIERVLLLKFEDLFSNTRSTLYKVANFLDMPMDNLARLQFDAPASINRYQHKDLSCFSSEQFDRLAAFGYPVSR